MGRKFTGAILVLLAFALQVPNRALSCDLFCALEKYDLETLASNLRAGSDPNIFDLLLGLPLHYAARIGWIDGIEALLAAGADPYANDGTGSAIAAAAAFDQVEALIALADGGANIAAPDDSGQTPLHAAARTGATHAIQTLVSHGASLEARMFARGEKPLHLAAREGQLSAVELLIELGADVATTDLNYEQTALHFAVRSRSLAVVQYLVRVGTPLNVVNDNGATALDLAYSNGNMEIVHYLQSIGATSAR